MSPVSRGRGKKNRSSKGPRTRRAADPVRPLPVADEPRIVVPDDLRGEASGTGAAFQQPFPYGPAYSRVQDRAQDRAQDRLRGYAQVRDRARAWWRASHAEVLDAARDLQTCETPDELAEATAGLLGDHWRRMHELHTVGLWPTPWLDALLDTAEPRVGEPAVRRLVHGIIAIAAIDQAAHAARVLDTAGTPVAADGQAEPEPAWLDEPPAVSASPDVLLLRDVYGLRFGVVARITVGDAPARTYLIDVDLCHGYDEVLSCGFHADVEAAAAAWRDGVGASAAGARPEPAPDGLLPRLLPESTFDAPFTPTSGDEMREFHRVDRVIHEILAALARDGRPTSMPPDTSERVADLVEEHTRLFREWATVRDVALPPPATSPDDDVVRSLLSDWVIPGIDESHALACSPHRIATFVAFLDEGWSEPARDQALALLGPWARYCLERTGVTGEAAEHVLAWADRAAHDPDAVAEADDPDAGGAVDETLVIRRG